eukprot:Nitzschia sp. Nitz4//scaffold189_size62959//9772//11385//NITZ4_006302-RA/size62959-augustus-gene-0.71-mRNA-1//1//CDS//3329539878//3499//frame0
MSKASISSKGMEVLMRDTRGKSTELMMVQQNKPSNNDTMDYLQNIECSDQPLDFSFHPKRSNLLAAALVDGTLEVHDIRKQPDDDDDEPDSILSSYALHTQHLQSSKESEKGKPASCRSVEFSMDGEIIYTGGSAGDLCCVQAERLCKFSAEPPADSLQWRIDEATEGQHNPLLVIKPFDNSSSLFATGDDSGGVRLWDQRLCGSGPPVGRKKLPQGCVLSWKENEDYITGIEHSDDGHTMLSTSADGRLNVFDLRMARELQSQGKPSFRLSDDQEDELLSLKIIKNGKKVVCGTQEGALSVFSWGRWGDCSDRFPGHPQSIDALLKVDEDTLLTGSSDGWIRVVQIHPDKLLGVIGRDHGGFPVESLGFNANRDVVGSITHDNYVHLWDARILQEGFEGDEDTEETDGKTAAEVLESAAQAAKTGNGSDNEWDDMDDKDGDDSDDNESEEDDVDVDSDDDDSDEDEKVETVNDRRKKRLKTDREKFFEDL